jgi:hypothetical protein
MRSKERGTERSLIWTNRKMATWRGTISILSQVGNGIVKKDGPFRDTMFFPGWRVELWEKEKKLKMVSFLSQSHSFSWVQYCPCKGMSFPTIPFFAYFKKIWVCHLRGLFSNSSFLLAQIGVLSLLPTPSLWSHDHLPPSQFLNLQTSILKMEGACSTETTVSAYKTAWCHKPDVYNLNENKDG